MLDLYAELVRVVEALDAAGVRYALAGGLAVSVYTTPRATADIDLLIPPDGLERAVTALEPLGFRRAGRPMRVAEGPDLLPVDLVLPVEPDLAASLEDRTSMSVEGWPVWVVGLRSLRRLKRLRGSPLDRADLEALGPEQ